MRLQWSPEAIAELGRRFGDARQWRLTYDTEGCGCAVNGVPALWAVDAPQPGDVAAESAPLLLWHDPRHEVFFEDALRIGYQADTKSFRLSSDNQIYTSRMVLADRREQPTGTAGHA